MLSLYLKIQVSVSRQVSRSVFTVNLWLLHRCWYSVVKYEGITAGQWVSLSVNKGDEGRWWGHRGCPWQITVSSRLSLWFDLSPLSGQSPVRPNRITKGRHGSHWEHPDINSNEEGDKRTINALDLWVRRGYTVRMLENLIIYSGTVCNWHRGEKVDYRRGRRN